jgi:radical SAM superfamily enzyme YgiQ (UPF0313 family)
MARKWSLAPELYVNADTATDQRWMDQMRNQDRTPVSTDTAKPRFTLVVGPSPFSMPRGWEFFLASPYEGATYIATVLHNAGYPTRIIDVRYSVDPMREAYEQIMQGTDVLGIATFEDNFPWVRELMEHVKFARPDIPIICGGSLVTSVPHIFMGHTACDIAVISEGELTILELMESMSRGSLDRDIADIRGVWYRTAEGEVKKTLPRGQMMDLDSLPRMRLDLWPQYHSEMGLQPQIIASYSRGCKMDCSFCYRTTPQVRSKSPEKFETDLLWLKEQYGTEFIFFSDLTFTSSKRQTLDNMEVLKGKDIRWTCLTRCADVDAERLKAMKDANCDIALYGVESLGKNILKEARKGNTENITIRSMRATWDAGIRFGALLIVGLPGETEESLDHVAQWAEEHNHVTRVKYLSAMPGTTVYSQGVKDGIIKSEIDHLNWLSIEQALHEDEFLNYNGLPEQVCRDAYKRIYDAYQPGPVMDFEHYPEHFLYHHPNPDDGLERSTSYAGEGWRASHSSASPHLIPGSERFTLDQCGTPEMASVGSRTVDSGAKVLGQVVAHAK